MKKVRNILLLALLGFLGFFGYKWFFGSADSLASFALIPSDAVYVVETSDAVEAWNSFAKSSFWTNMKKYPPLAEIGEMADGLDQIMSDNSTLMKAFGKRHVLISAHVIENDYDFLYVCDLSSAAKLSSVQTALVELMKSNGFDYHKTNEKETDIHSFRDPKDKSVLTMAFKGDKLICSYKFGLIMRALGALEEPSILENPAFEQINNETPSANMCKVYLNYAHLTDFLGVYSEEAKAMKPVFDAMSFTGLGVNLDDEELELKGFTNIKDSAVGYLQALSKSGNSEMRVHKVIPRNASFFLRFGFDNFRAFRDNLMQTMEENPMEAKSFKTKLKLFERGLGISLEEDLLGWVDNEIAMAQFQQKRYIANKLNNAIFVRAISPELAEEKFAKIEKRISHRTPIKIQVGDYKGHRIRRFEIKNIFKLFFGKAFDKVNKPYFTLVGDYMVFSDDAKTLLNIVDDFEAETTLDKQEDFKNFKDGFSMENNVFAYVNMPRFTPNMQAILKPKSYRELEKNTQYLMYFKHVGFELEWKAGENMFKTRLCTYNEIPNEETQKVLLDLPREFNEETVADSLSEADEFIVMYINGSAFKEYYDNGAIKYVARRKDGLLHGKYKEYYENGNVKAEGKYKKGERTGKWKFYNEDGSLEKTENYNNLLDTIKDKLGF